MKLLISFLSLMIFMVPAWANFNGFDLNSNTLKQESEVEEGVMINEGLSEGAKRRALIS